MQINNLNNYQTYNSSINVVSNKYKKTSKPSQNDSLEISANKTPCFKGSFRSEAKDLFKFLKALKQARLLNKNNRSNEILFRNTDLDTLDGIQYGIKIFKDLSMKEIQYISENLHIITVKRGCKSNCIYCYTDAKPYDREMSWEDFTLITKGFNKLQKRLGKLPIYGENRPGNSINERTTDVFYDTDGIEIALKDKSGQEHDFTDIVTELAKSMNRKSVFETSGWEPNNELFQKRAEKYANYFADEQNMNKLNEFNLSFNPFDKTYVAAIKALKAGNEQQYYTLENKFTDKIANAIYTFTPLLKDEKFNVLIKCFGFESKNSKYFNIDAIAKLIDIVKNKVEELYKKDLSGKQQYVHSEEEIQKCIGLISRKMYRVDTNLCFTEKMKQFMDTFGIKALLQDHAESVDIVTEDLKKNGRLHHRIASKLIDTDGKIYHIDNARLFPTELQLNISDKSPTPSFNNTMDFIIKRNMINNT